MYLFISAEVHNSNTLQHQGPFKDAFIKSQLRLDLPLPDNIRDFCGRLDKWDNSLSNQCSLLKCIGHSKQVELVKPVTHKTKSIRQIRPVDAQVPKINQAASARRQAAFQGAP